jgi:hypothetical protein
MEHNSKFYPTQNYSFSQDTTALQPNVFLTEKKVITDHKIIPVIAAIKS